MAEFATSSKRALLVLTHAMERAFDALPVQTSEPERGLVIALFQRREYFDVEADRYAAFAAAGHTVIVGFAGSGQMLPPGVYSAAWPAADPRSENWVLILLRGQYASALIAHDERDLSPGELTMQASRLFTARWTFQRQTALDDARAQLAALADLLPPAVVAAANAHIERSSAWPVSPVEAQLAAAADYLVSSLETGDRRASRLRVALDTTQTLAERDQLTGLHNRYYLERYLGDNSRPADLVTLLVDVDHLKTVNDTYGHAAGDAVLKAVSAQIRLNSRPTDVLVRWGGDEFILLVPNLDSAHGLIFAERLVQAIASSHPDPPWEQLALSVSIGVALTERVPLPLQRLDDALYRAKRDGKGQARLAAEVPRR